jgi:hypothetical protein
MTIEIWKPRTGAMSPWRAFDEMERAMDEMLGMRPMTRRHMPEEHEWLPSVEMLEKDNKFIVKRSCRGKAGGY